jgi:transposase
MADQPTQVILGVDTHAQVHVAALLDQLGRLLGTLAVPTTGVGYRRRLPAAAGLGPPPRPQLTRAGVEGTGTYGAGLARHLTQAGVQVIEVDRPNRQRRRRRGKSDPTDAEAAARAVLAGEATATAKTRSGIVAAIRVLRVARTSAVKARTQTANQLPRPAGHRARGAARRAVPAVDRQAGHAAGGPTARWRPRPSQRHPPRPVAPGPPLPDPRPPSWTRSTPS